MPLRYITKIGLKDCSGNTPMGIRLPVAISNIFGGGDFVKGDRYKCEITRWWSRDRSKRLDIKESTVLCAISGAINLDTDAVCRKYGFVSGDHLEILFIKRVESNRIRKESLFLEEKWEDKDQDVFPARIVDELLFEPDHDDATK